MRIFEQKKLGHLSGQMKLAVAALLLGLTGLAASLSQPLIPAFLNPNTGKLAVAALLLGLTGLAASLSQPLIPAFLNPNTGNPTE